MHLTQDVAHRQQHEVYLLACSRLQGCDTFTISPVTAGKLLNVQYTLDAASEFEAAARR